MASAPYRLSCSIYGHGADVRSVAATGDGKIVSGSRDTTAKLWTPNETGPGYRECLTLSSHNNFVSSVCALPPTDKYPNGVIVTGSNDKAIRLFDGTQSRPFHIITAHTNTVCKIVAGVEKNTILSSSWDQTAILWDLVSLKEVSVFAGHEQAVWAVVQLPCGVVATGSADRKIKIWIKNGSCLKTLSGHKDCVRDLAMLTDKEILSCSNDATVKHWDVESGECLTTYYGHGHFIYSIFSLGSLSFLTSSEDHTVRLWNNGEVTEIINVPADSVWSVSGLPNGDIVTGSSDGVIRVFSADPSRQAGPEELKVYDEQVSNLQYLSNKEIGGLKVSELPGEEALCEPGTREGQTRLIRKGTTVMAYSWSASANKWNVVGSVTGSSEGAKEPEKPVYNGKEYDYVFSVDIEEGKPVLKLPYNRTDDPWHAAQKFIHDNQLDQNYLSEVANFIIRNSREEGVDSLGNSFDGVDPFTGNARYVPGTNYATNGPDSAVHDPFTGSSRYRPKKRDDVLDSSSSSSPPPSSSSSYFPQREFLRFDQANLALILEKILDFNRKSGDGNQMIKENDIESLVKCCELGAHPKTEDMETLTRLLEWPQETVFPVLDVMRLAIRNPEANRHLCNDELLSALMKFLSPSCEVASNTMLALRVLTNMLSGEAGQALGEKNKLKLLSIIEGIRPPYGKSVQVAVATLLLNLSVMLTRSETPEGRREALLAAERILPHLTDQEAVFRAFVALGTLLVDALDRNAYSSLFVPILLKYESDSSSGSKIRECCRHVLRLFQ